MEPQLGYSQSPTIEGKTETGTQRQVSSTGSTGGVLGSASGSIGDISAAIGEAKSQSGDQKVSTKKLYSFSGPTVNRGVTGAQLVLAVVVVAGAYVYLKRKGR